MEHYYWTRTATANFIISGILVADLPNKALKEMVDRLKPLFSAKFPFENPPEVPEKIQWVKPRLVCEVSFAEWTDDEQMRQTTFLVLRGDKDPKEVVREV